MCGLCLLIFLRFSFMYGEWIGTIVMNTIGEIVVMIFFYQNTVRVLDF